MVLGFEAGSLADWFSSIATTAGILITLYFSLKNGKLQFELSVKIRGQYELIYSIINHSGFNVKVQMISLSFRSCWFKRSEFSQFLDQRIQMRKLTDMNKDPWETLEVNKLRQDTFQLAAIVDSEHQKAKLNGGTIPYDQKFLRFDINEFKNRQSFYVVLEVLAQDGKFYRSRPKKIKFKDITYLKSSDI
ncbi:hypothetical protein [Lactiplantibacillus plantarum]|uniref:hypothetical protein n=1 Tax=Lactiplantibacillus plantarum TaxID=1590 RepID=UPI000975C264|nr:hypothetical protein [Lactiplantibacillus plantarum]